MLSGADFVGEASEQGRRRAQVSSSASARRAVRRRAPLLPQSRRMVIVTMTRSEARLAREELLSHRRPPSSPRARGRCRSPAAARSSSTYSDIVSQIRWPSAALSGPAVGVGNRVCRRNARVARGAQRGQRGPRQHPGAARPERPHERQPRQAVHCSPRSIFDRPAFWWSR